jgi:DNA-binding beta-propeller fold protein YncE
VWTADLSQVAAGPPRRDWRQSARHSSGQPWARSPAATGHGPVTAYVVGEKGTVTPIRAATNTALKTISDRSADSLGIVITPDGKTAYVLNDLLPAIAPSTVTPVRTATNTTLPPVHVNGGPSSIAITPDSATAYVTDPAGEVIPISTATGKAKAPIAVGKGARAIAITPNGKTVYVALFGAVVDRHFGTVIPIRTATSKVLPPIRVRGTALRNRDHPGSRPMAQRQPLRSTPLARQQTRRP